MIPEKMKKFAQELTELAKKYKLMSISGQYVPGFNDRNSLGFHDTINYWWQSGRHEAETNTIKLQFQHTVHVEIEEAAQRQAVEQQTTSPMPVHSAGENK